jgi:peptide/nickel transport system permease protein
LISYLVNRLLSTVLVMGIVAIVVFSLLYLAPGDPAVVLAGDMASPADIEKVRRQLGLDQPFLIRFWTWSSAVLSGDLGTSIYSGLPVTTLIGQRIEATIALATTTILLSIAIAVPLGVLSAWAFGGWFDRAMMAASVLGFSIPVFVIAYILIYVFALELEWLPVQGYAPIATGILPFLESLILPSLALATIYIALIARMTRMAMLEVLSQDFVRTANAKGLSTPVVLLRHALKNAAVPIVTVIGSGVALLIGGVVVTESVFAIPGLGRLTVDAIIRRDYPVIQGVVLMFSFAYVLVNLLVDLSYTLFDPRIKV